MLVANPAAAKPGSKGRRKSAFAEEDEGYQYVEEGFRIRFANGETIDFYADSRAQKDDWMVVLSQVIGKPDAGRKAATWTDLVLARERAEGNFMSSCTSSPVKGSAPEAKELASPRPQTQPQRQPSHRKPVVPSKSAPTSPMKGAQSSPTKGQRTAPTQPAAAPGLRPKTPPMKQRMGHRSRDAVKSMIF